ncbi:MAG: pyruvate kinase, partial [Desulfomonile tiedjei]|nr:pyruvate kinase [Desulfomonile tiedjei]
MMLPVNKTKIVCTIGPACESPEILEQMIRTGMNVARLNFSHGDFDHHKESIRKIRAASTAVGRRIAIMADLPGPKMRIGQLAREPVELRPDDDFMLTVDETVG